MLITAISLFNSLSKERRVMRNESILFHLMILVTIVLVKGSTFKH